VNNNKQNFGGVNLIAADAQVPGRFYVTSTYNGRGILYGVPMTDCHGDSAGTAYYDACGVCAGGKTGVEPCKKDCSGELNGTAAIDKCGVCSGGNTGVQVDACLSAVNAASEADFVNLSPNPFSNEITLNSNQKVSYEIYNVFGSKLEEGSFEHSLTIGKNLENGIYFLNVSNGSQVQISKIIKK
jgi:hypothetical protein